MKNGLWTIDNRGEEDKIELMELLQLFKMSNLNPDKNAKERLSHLIRSNFSDVKMSRLAAELDIEAGTLRGWARGDTSPAMNAVSLRWLTSLAKAMNLSLPEILQYLYPEIEFKTKELTPDSVIAAINEWSSRDKSRVITEGFLLLPVSERMPLLQKLMGMVMVSA